MTNGDTFRRACAAVIGRVGEHELVACPGHRHVAQPPLLGERPLGRRWLAATETGRQRERLATTVAGEPPGDEPRQEDDREFEALRLVHGQDGDRIDVRVEVRGRRVVARVDERLEVPRHEHRPIVDEQRRLGTDDVEEPRHVGEPVLGASVRRRGQARHESAVAEERVEHLARRPFVRQRRVAAEVDHQAMDGLPTRRRDAQEPRLAVELLDDGPDGPVPAPGRIDDRRQVLPSERVWLDRRQGVEIDARLRIGDRPQEGHQQPDLGTRVQPGRTGEPPRDAGEVEGPQDRIGMPVGADEDRVVARRRPIADPPGDVGGDPVRFLRSGRERLETDRGGRRAGPLRPQALGHADPDLEAIRVVEADESMGGVEDGRQRSVVAAQDDRARTPIAGLEVEDVVDGGAAEGIDGLVVVPHHRHVAVRLREQRHELGLCPVRVLELVHEDVAEASGDRGPNGRRPANEAQSERDLVAEIDEAVLGEQALVGRVRRGELGLASRLLGDGVGRVAIAVGRRVAGRRQRLADPCRLDRDTLGVLRVRRRG